MGLALPQQIPAIGQDAPGAADLPAEVDFAVVVPAFNEAPNLETLIPEIFAAVEGLGTCQVKLVHTLVQPEALAFKRYASRSVTKAGRWWTTQTVPTRTGARASGSAMTPWPWQ